MTTITTGIVRQFAAAATAGEVLNNRRSTQEAAAADWAQACATGDQDALELLALAERFATADPDAVAEVIDCGANERRAWTGKVGAWSWALTVGDGYNNWGGRWFRFRGPNTEFGGVLGGVLELAKSGSSRARQDQGRALRAILDDERRWR